MKAPVAARLAPAHRLGEDGRLRPFLEHHEDMARVEATGRDGGKNMERRGQFHPRRNPKHGPGTVKGGMHRGEPVGAAIDGGKPPAAEPLPMLGEDPLRCANHDSLPGEGRIELIADNVPIKGGDPPTKGDGAGHRRRPLRGGFQKA